MRKTATLDVSDAVGKQKPNWASGNKERNVKSTEGRKTVV